MNTPKRILIVRTDRIGDVVLTTPAVKALRKHFPDAFIAMLVSPSTQMLVEDDPHLDRVLIDDRQGTHEGLFGFLKLVGEIGQLQFDTAIVYHTKRRTNLLCFLAAIPRRIGYKNNKFGFLLSEKIQDDRHHGNKHESQYCLDLLKTLGIDFDCHPEETQGRSLPAGSQGSQNQILHSFGAQNDITPSITVNIEAEDWAKEALRRLKDAPVLIALHPGASDPSKCWPATRFAEVASALRDKYNAKFVIVGDTAAQEAAARIKDILRDDVIDLTGKSNVVQMAAVLKRAKILISNDSGPVHVASAVGIGVVSIFTRNQPGINPQRWQPLGEKAKTIAIQPNFDLSFKKAGSVDPNYLELIKPQQVLEAVDALMKLC